MPNSASKVVEISTVKMEGFDYEYSNKIIHFVFMIFKCAYFLDPVTFDCLNDEYTFYYQVQDTLWVIFRFRKRCRSKMT